MARRINLNADLAEGWGAYDIGDDAALMRIIASANVACGMHAGDANTMHRIVMLAKEHGVSIGAHPGFNDLWGFGRREIRMKADEVERLCAYQIGALQAIAQYAGLKVTHFKAHGAMSNMAAVDDGYAMALARAIKVVDPTLIHVALAGSALERATLKLGLKLAREGFADRQYEDDGNLVSRSIPGSVYRDPETAVAQALRMAQHGEVVARSGKMIKVAVDTICVHGDEPSAVAVAKAVRAALDTADIAVVPLPELFAGR